MPTLIRANQQPLLALLVIAILPLAAAIWSYFGGLGVPSGRVNRGELVSPPLAVDRWKLTDSAGQPWQGAGRWQLLLVVEQCDADCQRWRYSLGQLQRALGRDQNRLGQQLVLPLRAFSDQQATPALEDMTRLLSAVVTAANQGIWLADPLGNLVLRYRLNQPPQDLLKDLKRLLKVSNIG